ncbi:MAG: hypothetical protein ACRDCT_14900 [Shewanella sp.]
MNDETKHLLPIAVAAATSVKNLGQRFKGMLGQFMEFAGDGCYLAMLLLLAADVELNPGPITDALFDERMEKMTELFTKKFDEFCKVQADTNAMVNNLDNKLDVKFSSLEKANEALSKKVDELQNQLDSQASNERRKNIIVFGADSKLKLNDFVPNLITVKLQIRESILDSIDKYFYIGKTANKQGILIKFVSERAKSEVMRNAHLLKGTKFVLQDDLTPEERKVKRTVVLAQKEAKKLDISAKIRNNKGLLIGDKFLGVKDLSRAGWAEKFLPKRTTLRRKLSATGGAEASALSATDAPSDAPNEKKQKQNENRLSSNNDDVFVDEETNQTQNFPLAPALTQTKGGGRGRGRGGARVPSLERPATRGSRDSQ